MMNKLLDLQRYHRLGLEHTTLTEEGVQRVATMFVKLVTLGKRSSQRHSHANGCNILFAVARLRRWEFFFQYFNVVDVHFIGSHANDGSLYVTIRSQCIEALLWIQTVLLVEFLNVENVLAWLYLIVVKLVPPGQGCKLRTWNVRERMKVESTEALDCNPAVRHLKAYFIAMLLGGTWLTCLLAAVSAAVIDRVGRLLNRIGTPFFFQNVAGAAIVTLVAVAAYWFAGLNPTALVATGIVLLLTGLTFVGAMQDAVTGYTMTAVAQLSIPPLRGTKYPCVLDLLK